MTGGTVHTNSNFQWLHKSSCSVVNVFLAYTLTLQMTTSQHMGVQQPSLQAMIKEIQRTDGRPVEGLGSEYTECHGRGLFAKSRIKSPEKHHPFLKAILLT